MDSNGNRNQNRREGKLKARGFTLIELLIAVAIVGILASIAYPSYRASIMKSQRIEGKELLLEVANREAVFRSNFNTYTDVINSSDTCDGKDCGLAFPDTGATSKNGYYALTVATNVTDTTFTLTATPVTGSAQAGDKCGAFVLDNTGRRTLSGAAAGLTVQDCW